MATKSINGVSLGFRELGSRNNPTIVFAHPVLFDSTVFDRLAAELTQDFHLVLLDIHGHGESGYRSPITLEDITTDFYQLLSELGIARCTWIGYSIGGMIGMRLAITHPILFKSLVLIATSASVDSPQLLRQTETLWRLFRAGHREDVVDAALRFFFAGSTFETQPQLVASHRERINNYSHAQAEGIFQVAAAVLDRIDISYQIQSIRIPALVIAGKEDPAAPPEESELIASRIPGAAFAVVDNASHLLVVEQPEEVSALIGDFVRKGKMAGRATAATPSRLAEDLAQFFHPDSRDQQPGT
jgi:3-oxoadipate enol-lactonase